MRSAIVAALFVFIANPSNAQNEPPLIRLTKQATSPQMVYDKGGLHPRGEKNLEGWLVLNAARFRNSEYPVLARVLREDYAARGVASSSDSEFTQLPYEPNESDSHGQIKGGTAICPSPALCGDLTGVSMPFNLNASL